MRRHWLAVAVIVAEATTPSSVGAASYWLDMGYDVIADCPGATEGVEMKAANGDSNLRIQGILTCTDIGDSYRLDVNYISVEVNPFRPMHNAPDVLHFDWFGLAIYRPADATEETIEWLYEEALPIAGELPKDSDETLWFGRLSFTYPKATAEQATRFTFYLTYRGRLEQFGLL